MSDEEKRSPDIGLVYPKGAFSAEELSEYNRELEAAGLSFGTCEDQTTGWACFDVFVPLLKVFLSHDFVLGLSTGMLSAMAWDGAKAVIKRICKSVADKKPRRLTGGRIEDIKEPIHIIVGNISVVLPAGSNDEVIQHTVDKAFEYLLKETSTQYPLFALYDDTSESFKSFTERELLDQIIAEHRAEQAEKDEDILTVHREEDTKETP